MFWEWKEVAKGAWKRVIFYLKYSDNLVFCFSALFGYPERVIAKMRFF